MKYIVESIGAHFTNKDIAELENTFNRKAQHGYRFHSVFDVSQPSGCFGNKPVRTYLAIYENIDNENQKPVEKIRLQKEQAAS